MFRHSFDTSRHFEASDVTMPSSDEIFLNLIIGGENEDNSLLQLLIIFKTLRQFNAKIYRCAILLIKIGIILALVNKAFAYYIVSISLTLIRYFGCRQTWPHDCLKFSLMFAK